MSGVAALASFDRQAAFVRCIRIISSRKTNSDDMFHLAADSTIKGHPPQTTGQNVVRCGWRAHGYSPFRYISEPCHELGKLGAMRKFLSQPHTHAMRS